MCGRSIYNFATKAVLGVPFLGVSAGPGELLQRAELQSLAGAGPLLPMRGCLAQTLHHAAASGLGRGFAISPLWHDLWTPSLTGTSPRSLGGEGGTASAGSRQTAKLIWLSDNLRDHLSIAVLLRRSLTPTATREARLLTPNPASFPIK